jgi:signal transduction histidine kinase
VAATSSTAEASPATRAAASPAGTGAFVEPSAAAGGPAPPRRASSGIRVRIVVGYLVLLTAALATSIVIARHVQTVRLEREVANSLRREAQEIAGVAAGGDFDDVRALFDEYLTNHRARDHEAFYVIPLEDGFGDGIRRSFAAPVEVVEDADLIRTWASTGEQTLATYDTPVGETRAVVVPIVKSDPQSLEVADEAPGALQPDRVLGVFVVAHFMDPHQNELNELVRVLVLSSLAVLVVTSAVVWALAGRILAPVRHLTEAAQAVTHSDLSARIPVAGSGELAQLGTTFNEMVERLDRGFRAQRRFLDDIAHDLRTPLTIARGHLETLGDDPAEREETVTIVLNELDRMGRSVTDLLVLAKAEQPHFLRLEVVDYGDFASDLMSRVSGLAPRSWVIDAAPRPGVLAGEADTHRLFEAMLNLVANAVQHTRDGDEIGIGVAGVASGAVRMWVRDHGPGIDVDDPDVLFQRFRQGRSTASRRDGAHHDGMGLGLSIVDAIARAHGGRASYQPSFGRGSTFVIEIPLAPPTDQPEP